MTLQDCHSKYRFLFLIKILRTSGETSSTQLLFSLPFGPVLNFGTQFTWNWAYFMSISFFSKYTIILGLFLVISSISNFFCISADLLSFSSIRLNSIRFYQYVFFPLYDLLDSDVVFAWAVALHPSIYIFLFLSALCLIPPMVSC